MSRNSAYMNDVDELIAKTSVATVLASYGQPLPEKESGEHRMTCVFNESCADSEYGQLTVKLDDRVHRIYCHTCGVRGNLLTLLHGLETHQPPTGGKLRGDEFKAAVAKLREISGGSTTTPPPQEKPTPPPEPRPETTLVNIPLIHHDKPAARELANLYEELIVDVEQMSPEAAKYVRARPWMTPDLMRKWGVGWIPGNGRSLFRKNYLVYTHRNQQGEVLSYSGRDLQFEKKWQAWLKEGRPEGKKPSKHRYVAGYHKGQELYGGQSGRLKEPYVRESLKKYGVVVVEGMNDVLRLEELEIAATALCSNKPTDTQVQTIVKFARQSANNKVTLFPDCDEPGEAGFKELLWKLAEQQVEVRLGWSSTMFEGRFTSRQPEGISTDEWHFIVERHCPRTA
ncbi:MAG: hypothetical protein KDA88_07205 [Planctomycetaceae bacterium]|nr:hypothetical protein [Planctomycetaceae bacterium]